MRHRNIAASNGPPESKKTARCALFCVRGARSYCFVRGPWLPDRSVAGAGADVAEPFAPLLLAVFVIGPDEREPMLPTDPPHALVSCVREPQPSSRDRRYAMVRGLAGFRGVHARVVFGARGLAGGVGPSCGVNAVAYVSHGRVYDAYR